MQAIEYPRFVKPLYGRRKKGKKKKEVSDGKVRIVYGPIPHLPVYEDKDTQSAKQHDECNLLGYESTKC
jgi:hypothetical protein